MTEQIERDLTAMFEGAAAQLDVRPPAPRALRLTRLNTALAGALTLALVGGVAVAGVRLASTPTNNGRVSLAGGDAKAVLLAAVRHTFARPMRMITRIELPGSPVQTVETDVDYGRREAVQRSDGQVQMFSVSGHAYQRLSTGMKATYKAPASTEWLELPLPAGAASATATAASAGWASLFGVDPSRLDDPAVTARFSVDRVSPSGFRVKTAGADQEAQDALFTVGAAGTVTRVQLQVVMSGHAVAGLAPPPVQKFSVDVAIGPLGAPLQLTPPDPRTVLSYAQLQELMRRQRPTGAQACPTATPSPVHDGLSSTTVMCSSSVTVVATPAVAARPTHS